MKYSSKLHTPLHWKHSINKGKAPSRNMFRYVSTMNPGKPHKTSIPLVYLLKQLNLQAEAINRRALVRAFRKAEVRVNGTRVTDPKAPVNISDVIRVNENPPLVLLYLRHRTRAPVPKLVPRNGPRTQFPVRYFKHKGGLLRVQTNSTAHVDFEMNQENLRAVRDPRTCIVWDPKPRFDRIQLSDHKLVKLTGRDYFSSYQIGSLKRVQSEESNYYNLVLKGEKSKETLLSLRQLRKRYLFVKKAHLE